MPQITSTPREGQLWLSRPPYLLTARVRSVDPPAAVEYELLDEDGSVLTGPVVAPLDHSWWDNFQPLVRRTG